MKKIKYLFRCIKRLDVKNMFVIINNVSKKSKKNKLWIFIDVIYCGLVYGAGYYDYQEFEFYLLSNKERKTYLTRVKNNMIVKKYNNPKEFYKFDDKGVFNELFKDYLKRDYLVIDEKSFSAFKKFISRHKSFIAKPIDGDGGKGVEKIVIKDDNNLDEVFASLILKKQLLLEELITQHEEINELYEGAVNSLRLFTFFDGVNGYVLNSVFKLGNGGVTDNFSSGSMYTFTDDEGVVIVPAIDRNDDIYEIHPITGKKITGFKVPFYKEACEMVIKAASVVNDVRYIGWDVAITPKGPVIIEGNCFPGVFQIKPHLAKEHVGLITKYKKYMDF